LAANFGGLPSRRSAGSADQTDSFADDTLSRRETLELVRAYYRITDPSIRKRVFDLIKSMGPAEP
jgi:ABC-type multidrug transport system ATPase subunit